MYLSKLEILGFKSFADKIDLNFKDGLSAIVGPNGSGKTNFVDALRWVLGEQKTSVLRSESMENVIFNGSRNRKPLGLSEVSITIKNNKKILPSEYDEINISRRLYRDGESQYLINKVPARLKDITGLFMDTGLGADSYSVIELKMIENLLNGNPADRRDIFEEAAGIKKFKQNKKETTKRLQNVELDLERLNDILQEVQKNVNSLYRQAAKTRRYNALVSELKDMETKLFAFELLSYRKKLNSKENQEGSAKEQLIIISEEIKEIESFLTELKVKFSEVDEEYQRILQAELTFNNQLSTINSELNRNEEKINSLDSTQLKINYEIEETRNLLNISKDSFEKLIKEIETLRIKESNSGSNFELIRLEGKAIQQKYNQKVFSVAEINGKINQLKNKLSYNQSVIERNSNLISKNAQSIQAETDKWNEINKSSSESKTQFDEKIKMLEEAEKSFSTAKQELDILNQTKKETEISISELRNTELEVKSQLNKLQSEINFLESIVINDESTKHLLKNENWAGKEEKILLGEIISIDEKYKKAINSALDSVISSFLIDDFDKAKKAIEELKSSKKGVSHFVLNKSKANNLSKEKISFNGFLGYLGDYIQVNEEHKEIIENLTNDILVFSDLHSAAAFFENSRLSSIYNLVTLDGEFISSKGIISGGSEANQKNKIIGRRNRIKQLEKEIDTTKSELKQIQDKLSATLAELNNLNIPVIETYLRNIEEKLNSSRREMNRFELNLESLTRNSEHIQEKIAKMKFDSNELEKENEKIIASDAELNEELQKFSEELETEKIELETEKIDLDDWNQKSKQSEIDLVRIQSDIRYMNSEIQKLENSIKFSNQKISEKENEFLSNKDIKLELNSKISEGLKEKENLIEQIQGVISQKEILASNRKNFQEQIINYEATIDNARKNLAKHSEESHSIELEIASLRTRIEGLYETASEKYDADLDEYIEKSDIKDEDIAAFDISTAKTDIALHREKMNLLGSVNFSALEDYEEQKTRLDFLLTQLTDLKNSQKLLAETIEEINKIATEKFIVTFNEINNNFKNLFKVLFGQEGEAELKLEGESALDASVLISAKPPFKKPNSIDLLSAGEKTLTAIALLFSIYLVKPSPFCVLDEVDAPLDDYNIDKYIALIRKFSQERDIQFILITHNKKTMEAADTLYGLTMEEEGVTKVVSVRLESI